MTERLDKRREQQSRIESKTRAVVRINMCLSAGEYARALEVLQRAAAEFPNDAELAELEKLAADGAKRKTEADRLITESQELFAQQKSGKAIELLREAYALDKNNVLARSILANALVEHAHLNVEANWWEAETLANEALVLNPAHPTAKTIPNLIVEQKKAASIDEWVAQTSRLQAAGNLAGALSQIAEGFEIYPREPRLLQVQDAIQRDYGAQRRQARRRDLEDLRRMASELNAATDVAARAALADSIKALTVKHSTDGEILSVANALLLRLGQLGVRQKSAAAAAGSEVAPVIYQAPVPKAPETLLPASSPALPKPIGPGIVASGVVAPDKATVKPAPRRTTSSSPAVGAIDAATTSREKIPPAPQMQIRAEQPAAARAAEPSVVAVKSRARETSGPAKLEKSNAALLIGGGVLAIVLVAAISFFVGKHQAAPTKATAAAVSTPAVQTAAAPANAAPTSPTLATAPSAPAPSTPEPPVATADESKQPVSETPPMPPTNSAPDRSVGTLLIITNQDEAKVFLNGKLQAQRTHGGQVRLPNLVNNDYVVEVAKAGFQPAPQQKIRIRGGEAKLSFTLQPQSQVQTTLASLRIQGGIPGSTVLVDQTPVGTIQADGTLSVSTINPGDHVIELRKERFKPRQLKEHFVAGSSVSLIAADAALEALPGELKINYTPADARVVIAKSGMAPTIVNSGVALNLSPGTYTLTARNPDGFTRYGTLEVAAGQLKSLDLPLAPNGMAKWEDPGAWKREGESYNRKGGDFVLYGVAPSAGTFVLSAMATKGHSLQWVLNYTDAKNYVLFQLDENNFSRTVIRNGQKTDEVKVADKGDKKSFRTLRIRVSPTEIVHQIKHGDRWTVVDDWTQAGANVSAGKFGFNIPRGDQVEISSFVHYADLNIR